MEPCHGTCSSRDAYHLFAIGVASDFGGSVTIVTVSSRLGISLSLNDATDVVFNGNGIGAGSTVEIGLVDLAPLLLWACSFSLNVAEAGPPASRRQGTTTTSLAVENNRISMDVPSSRSHVPAPEALCRSLARSPWSGPPRASLSFFDVVRQSLALSIPSGEITDLETPSNSQRRRWSDREPIPSMKWTLVDG